MKWRLSQIATKRNTVAEGTRKVDPRTDGMRRYQISFAGHNPGPRFELGAAEEEKEEQKYEKEGRQGGFKRVLTPRQGLSEPHGGEASSLENYGSACLP